MPYQLFNTTLNFNEIDFGNGSCWKILKLKINSPG